MSPFYALYGLWIVWFASWIAAAFWSGRTAERPRMGSELPYRVVTLSGSILLFGFVGPHVPVRLWRLASNEAWALFGVCACGFAFAWWARLHLGRLWSGWITRKEGHRVVDTGPYAIVRHPIYTGIIASVLATAAMKGTAIALSGASVMVAGFWIKARLEERFLRAQLGTGAYDSYRRRVPMLVPFGPKAA